MSYGQLQFPTNGVITPVYRYADAQPPFLPPIPTPDPELQNMIAPVASAVANQAGEKTAANPARVYHYNVLANNGFNNQDFAATVSMVIDYVYSSVVNKRMFRNFWEAIPSSVDFVLRVNCAHLAVNIRDLMMQLPADIQNDTMQTANQFQSMMAEIMQVRQQTQGRVNSYGPSAVYVDPRMGNQPVGGFPGGAHVAPQAHNYHSRPVHPALHGGAAAAHQNHAGVGSLLFGGGPGGGSTEAKIAHTAVAGKHDYLTNQRNARTQAQQAQAKPAHDPRYQPEPVPQKWASSPAQTYVSLARAHEEYYLSINNEFGRPHTVMLIRDKALPPLQPGENPMDRKAHVLGSVAHTAYSKNVPVVYPSREKAYTGTMSEIGNAAMVAAGVPDDQVPETVAGLTRFYGQQIVAPCPNLDSAIFTVRYLHKKELGRQSTATAFRYDLNIRQPFIAMGDYYDRLQAFRSARTFPALAGMLRAILINPKEDQELRDIVTKLDTYLTKELNEVLQNKLSFPLLRISSFIDDANDLFKAVLDEHGQPALDALVGHQTQFIDTFTYFAEPLEYDITDRDTGEQVELDQLPDQASGEADADAITDVEAKAEEPIVQAIETVVSVTVLEMVSLELNMTMPPDGLPAMIDSYLPDLYNFAKATIDAAVQLATSGARLASNTTFYFAHHYLVTADDVVYELHQGLLNKESYLLSRR